MEKGWEAMRDILDREMPQKNRRRVVGWWLTGILLPTVAAGIIGWGVHYFYNRKEQSHPPAPQTFGQQPPIARHLKAGTSEVHASVPSAHDPMQSAAHTPSPGKNQQHNGPHARPPHTHSEAPPRFSERPQQEMEKRQQEYPENVADSPAQMASPGSQPSAAASVNTIRDLRDTAFRSSALPGKDTVGVQSSDLEASDAVVPVSEAVQVPGRQAEMPHLVAGALSPLSLTPQRVPHLPTPSLKRPAALRRWQWGLSVEALCPSFSNVQGYGIGFVADRSLAKRLGMRTGLRYAHHQWPATGIVAGKAYVSIPALDYYSKGYDLSVVYTNQSGSGFIQGVPTDSLSGRKVYMRLIQMQRLEVPVQMTWRPVKRMRLYVGGLLGWNLRVKGAYSQSVIPESLIPRSNTTSFNTTAVQHLISDALPRFSVRLQSGLGWNITRRIEIVAGAHLPLSFFGNAKEQDASVPGVSPISVGNNADGGSPLPDGASAKGLSAVWSLGGVFRLR